MNPEFGALVKRGKVEKLIGLRSPRDLPRLRAAVRAVDRRATVRAVTIYAPAGPGNPAAYAAPLSMYTLRRLSENLPVLEAISALRGDGSRETHTVDVGYVHVLATPGGPCAPTCPHPDHHTKEEITDG